MPLNGCRKSLVGFAEVNKKSFLEIAMDCKDVQLSVLETDGAGLPDDVAQHVSSCSVCQDFRRACALALGGAASDAPSRALDDRVKMVCHEALAAGGSREEGSLEVLPFAPVFVRGKSSVWRRLAVAASLLLMGALAGLVTLKFRSDAARAQRVAVQATQPTGTDAWFDEDLDLVLLSLEAELLFAEAESESLAVGESRGKAGIAHGDRTDQDLDSLDRELLEIEMHFLLGSELL